MFKPCRDCPLENVLNNAESLIDEIKHNNPEASKGGIVLTRLCFNKIVNANICQGPISNSDAQLVCPLRDQTMFLRNLASAPWPSSSFEVDLKRLKNENESREYNNNGMYL